MTETIAEPLELKRYLKIAVIEHLHGWWCSDGLLHRNLLQQSGDKGNTVDHRTVRKIAQLYGVGRSVRSGKEVNLAALLDERLRCWPTSLIERAEFVKETAQKAMELGITRGCLLSAFSKLYWFACPIGWTMYDSFAARGVCAVGTGLGQFVSFYSRLHKLDFGSTMELCRTQLRNSYFPYLWPERILDKYLMYCGHREEETVIDDLNHAPILSLWEHFHDRDIALKIGAVVDVLAETVKDCPLFKLHIPIAQEN